MWGRHDEIVDVELDVDRCSSRRGSLKKQNVRDRCQDETELRGCTGTMPLHVGRGRCVVGLRAGPQLPDSLFGSSHDSRNKGIHKGEH